MTLEQAQQILAEVEISPPLATYTFAQIKEALRIVSTQWGIPR